MAGTQSQPRVKLVRPRRGEDGFLSAPLAEPVAIGVPARAMELPARTTQLRHARVDLVLLVEIGFVASMVTWVGFLTRGASLTVAAVLALVLITLYHSGREVTRQGLPHLGRIVRDMAIPVAIMATVGEFYAPGRGVIQDSIQMVAVGTASAVFATLVRRQMSGRVRIVVAGGAAAIAQAATMWAGSKRVEIVGALRLPVADEDPDSPVELFGVPVFTGVENLAEQVSSHDAELVVVLAGPSIDSALMRKLSWSLEDSEASLALLSALDGVAPHRIQTTQFDGTTLVHVTPGRPSAFVRAVKNALDRAAALLLLVLLAPVILSLALLVRLESRGPGFFRQTRIGQHGRPFTMIKLRTMCDGAHGQRAELAEQNERDGCLFKMRQDPRVTRVGRVLRRTSLDELPQLFNVLRGDMALVGPRPALPEEVRLYDELARRRLAVRPGLTGLSQVSGRASLSYDSTIQLDVRYTDNWRLVDDLAIGARTVQAVVSSRGAY